MEKIKVFLNMVYPLLICIFMWGYFDIENASKHEDLLPFIVTGMFVFATLFFVGLVMLFVHIGKERRQKRKNKKASE